MYGYDIPFDCQAGVWFAGGEPATAPRPVGSMWSGFRLPTHPLYFVRLTTYFLGDENIGYTLCCRPLLAYGGCPKLSFGRRPSSDFERNVRKRVRSNTMKLYSSNSDFERYVASKHARAVFSSAQWLPSAPDY